MKGRQQRGGLCQKEAAPFTLPKNSAILGKYAAKNVPIKVKTVFWLKKAYNICPISK